MSRAARQYAWNSGGNIASRAISLVALVVLARLLPPSAFGIWAFGAALLSIAEMIRDQGLTQALVAKQHVADSMWNTAFWSSLGISAVASIIMMAIAPAWSTLLGEQATPVFIAIAAIMPINAAASIPIARMRRELDFRSLALRTTASSLLAAVVGIMAGLFGLGVWALVAQAAAHSITSLVLVWAFAKFRPSLTFDSAALRSLLSFGWAAGLSSLGSVAVKRVPDVGLGTIFGASTLGYYSIAWRLVQAVLEVTARSYATVLFPVAARLRRRGSLDAESLRRAYRYALIIALPAFVGIGALAPELIALLFGTQWLPASAFVYWLCLAGLAQTMLHVSTSLLFATERPRIPAAHQGVVLVLGTVVFMLGAQASAPIAVGMWALAQVLAGASLIYHAADSQISLNAGWRLARAPLFASALMGAILLALRDPAQSLVVGLTARTLTMTLLGLAVYVTALYVLDPVATRRLVHSIGSDRK
jgi:O-antigen/teichoic acid export membrane protein